MLLNDVLMPVFYQTDRDIKPMTKGRILVVDDSRETVQYLAETLLPTHGYKTAYAFDGVMALEAIRADKPDLVILDLNLPEMTGIDVLETLAQEPLNVPVVLMTGGGSEKSAIDAFRLGVKDYLVKPFTASEVVETIARVLDEHDADSAEKLAVTYNQLWRQKNQYGELINSGVTLNALDNANAIVDHALFAARTQCQAEASFIWLPDEETGQLKTHCQSVGQPHTRLYTHTILNQYVERVLVTGDVVRMANFSTGIETGHDHITRALLYVPLRIKGDVRGILGVINQYEPRAFSKHQEYLLAQLGRYAATALEHVYRTQKLNADRAVHTREMRAFIEIVQLVTEEDDPHEVLHRAVEHLQRNWLVESASLWLFDDAANSLSVFASAGTHAALGSDREVGASYADYVAESGQWMFSNNVVNHPPRPSDIDLSEPCSIRSILCVPLMLRGRCFGVLQLVNNIRNQFREQDIEQVSAISSLLAMTIRDL